MRVLASGIENVDGKFISFIFEKKTFHFQTVILNELIISLITHWEFLKLDGIKVQEKTPNIFGLIGGKKGKNV